MLSHLLGVKVLLGVFNGEWRGGGVSLERTNGFVEVASCTEGFEVCRNEDADERVQAYREENHYVCVETGEDPKNHSFSTYI